MVALPETTPAHTLPVHLPRMVEMIVKSVAVPALGLGGRVPSLTSRTLALRTVRGCVDERALAVTRHTPPLPVCVLDAPGRSLLTATRTVECACALDDCARVRQAIERPGVTACGHTGPTTGHLTVAGLVTAHGLGRGVGGLDGVAGIARRLLLLPAITATTGSTVGPAPAVAGGSVPLPKSSFTDLVRLFFSLSGPVAQ